MTIETEKILDALTKRVGLIADEDGDKTCNDAIKLIDRQFQALDYYATILKQLGQCRSDDGVILRAQLETITGIAERLGGGFDHPKDIRQALLSTRTMLGMCFFGGGHWLENCQEIHRQNRWPWGGRW